MADSGDNGWEEEQPGGTAGGMPPERGGNRSEKTPAKKLVQFSSGLSRPFIQRPVMTMLLTASIIVFGVLTYNQLAVNDLPAVDYPVIQVSVSYPGANPGNDGEHDRHSARETVHPDSRADPNDELEHAGQHPDHPPVRSRQENRCRRHRRAIGHPARHRPAAVPICRARPLSQDQSERSAGHVHRPDERHADRWRAL